MSGAQLTYAVITPARNEADDLPRLAGSLTEQTVLPRSWIIVDDGSTDETRDLASGLAASHDWTVLVETSASPSTQRGGKVVRAFLTGLAALPSEPDVVIKVDADVSFPSDYFERLLAAFARDDRLGMASGSGYELKNGVWRERHMTAGSLWGAARAYRWACLQDVLPLEERMGWDGIDALKANLHGWETRLLSDLSFRHHRIEGERDGRRIGSWATQGRGAHYMGYRPLYLVLRSLNYSRGEGAALFMIVGYVQAAIARQERCDDELVMATLRRRQRLRDVPTRALEALGRRAT